MPNKAPERKSKTEPVKIELVSAAARPAPKPQKAKESGAVLRYCSCTSAFQDRRYGAGRRVFCCAPKGTLSCTVCGGRS